MHRIHRIAIATLLAATANAAALSAASAEVRKFRAELNGTQEQPAVVTEARGSANLTLDTATKKLDWTITYGKLTGPATAAHIHGPAVPGENAGVVVNLAPQGMKSPLTGSATLTDAQLTDLMAGKYYINVHTDQNKGGEIRGQLNP